MTIGASPREILNSGNPGNVADGMSASKLGDGLMLIPRFKRGSLTSSVLVLPSASKAIAILACFATAGTTPGWKTPVKTGSTLSTGQCMVNSTGDIELYATDACTEIEVVYVKLEQGALITETLAVSANSATLLQGRKGVTLVSATITGGVGTGVAALVQTRAGSVTNTTKFVCLDLLGTHVLCAATDVVTSITVTYIAEPGAGAGVVAAFADRMLTTVSGTPTV